MRVKKNPDLTSWVFCVIFKEIEKEINMTDEEFRKEIQFWTNLELIRYKNPTVEQLKAINDEIAFRIEHGSKLFGFNL